MSIFRITIASTLTFSLSIIASLGNCLYAQGTGMNRDVVLRSHGSTMFYKPPPEDIIGSPYLYDVWFSGYLFLKNDTTPYEAAFLYDASGDVMLFTDGEDTMSVAKPLLLDRISFANMTFVYALSIETSGGQDFIRGGFYQLMAGDSLRLLEKNSKSVDDNRSVNHYMGGGGDGRRRYIQSKSLYVQRKGGDAIKLRRNKSWILGFMKDREQEMVAFIDNEKINLQSTIDLVRLFDHYNQLINE